MKLDNRFKGTDCLRTNIYMSIDGVHFRICEPSPFSRKWYSHKFKGPALTYEIALGIRSGDIVWAHGGYPAGEYPDEKLSRTAFVHVLDRDLNEHVIADNGYDSLPWFISPVKNRYTVGDLNARRVLARHENVNARIQRFKILRDRYHGDLRFHPTIFHAIVNICQLEIENMSNLPSVQGVYE